MPTPDFRQQLVDRQSMLTVRLQQRAARITLAEANLAAQKAQHQIATGELAELAKVIAQLPAPAASPAAPEADSAEASPPVSPMPVAQPAP